MKGGRVGGERGRGEGRGGERGGTTRVCFCFVTYLNVLIKKFKVTMFNLSLVINFVQGKFRVYVSDTRLRVYKCLSKLQGNLSAIYFSFFLVLIKSKSMERSSLYQINKPASDHEGSLKSMHILVPFVFDLRLMKSLMNIGFTS